MTCCFLLTFIREKEIQRAKASTRAVIEKNQYSQIVIYIKQWGIVLVVEDDWDWSVGSGRVRLTDSSVRTRTDYTLAFSPGKRAWRCVRGNLSQGLCDESGGRENTVSLSTPRVLSLYFLYVT